MSEHEQIGDVKAALDFATENVRPGLITPEDVTQTPHIIFAPDGQKILDLTEHYDQFRDKPRHLIGNAGFTEVESFNAHVNRFKNDHSTIFATRSETDPSLLAVYDYHPGHGDPRFAHHRARYAFPVSEEWKAWRDKDGKGMDQATFATFIEKRISDLSSPPVGDARKTSEPGKLATMMKLTIGTPAEVMQVSRGLRVEVKSEVTNAITLASGEGEISFKSDHTTKIKVPGMFLIGIPVFEAGSLYQLAVLLRYRSGPDGLVWFYELYRPEITFRAAFDDTVEIVKKETDLPVWFGSSE